MAIGSNLTDPPARVREAFERLGLLPATRLVLRSRLYKTAPMGPQDQPHFVNAAAGLLTQLARATGTKIHEADLNFMVSFINGIEPRDQVESTLAAQMATVHMAMMKSMQDLPLTQNLLQQDAVERAINKFARTFIAQVEALKRYRSGGEQKVTVHHVSVSEGGQAILGNVTQGQRDVVPNGVPAQPLALTHDKTRPMAIIESKTAVPVPARVTRSENDGRTCTQYDADACEPALRRQDAFRQALPIACRPG